MDHCHRDVQSALHAARVAAGDAVGRVRQPEPLEQLLHPLLEQQVVPRFEARDAWLEMMKASIAELAPRFSMARTVIDYAERYYVPAARS